MTRALRLLVLLPLFTVISSLAATEVVLTVPEETELTVADTKDTQTAWLEMIRLATKTLDIEQFYVSDEKGQALEPVLAEIRTAARRGVKVRLLVDKKFFKTYPDTVTELGKIENIESRTVDYDALMGGVQHAKFMVADGADAYIGSANFDWRALSHIHEVGLRVTDPKLGQALTEIFAIDWEQGVRGLGEATVALPQWTGGAMELVGSPTKLLPKGTPFSLDRITKMIEGASKRLRIQLYDYSTKVYGKDKESWHDLERLLIRTAKKGVAIDFLVDAKTMDKAKGDLQALAKCDGIRIKVVKIPVASSGEIPYARLIHSKYLTVDDKSYWVGTDNWGKSYFYNTRGVGIIGSESDVAATLDAVYEKLWTSPYAASFK